MHDLMPSVRVAIAALTLAVAASAMVPATASACSCVQLSLSEHTQMAALAFVGTATSTRVHRVPLSPGAPANYPLNITTFRVERQWKGAARDVVDVWSSPGEAICGYVYRVGGRYLVFAGISASRWSQDQPVAWSGSCDSFPIARTGHMGGVDPAVPVGQVCPGLEDHVSTTDIVAALGEPQRYAGWWRPAHPNRAPGPFNPPRAWLSLRTTSKPYGPMNPLVWKAGCP